MKDYLKLLKKTQISAGFTLAEVLLAASLSMVVVGAAGFGLVNLLRNNQIANASSEIEYDLNRAVEFISDEIRAANKVGTVTSGSGFDTDAGKRKPILVLEMPQVDASGNPIKVVYYTRAKADEPSSNKTQWQGPQILYRWGPNFDSNGLYKLNTDGKIPTPTEGTTWQYEPLIDLIADSIDANKKICKNTGTDWRRYPFNDADVKGFFACIRSDGKLVELHANSATTLNSKDTVTDEVTTEVFARAEAATGGGGTPYPTFKIETDTRITLIDRARVSLQEVATNLDCTQNKEVTTNLWANDPRNKINDPTKVSSGATLNEQQQIFIEVSASSVSNDCLTLTKYYLPARTRNEGGKWIKVIKNGDSLASIVSDPSKLESLLKSSTTVNPDHTVKLAANEVLLFVEIEKKSSSIVDYDEKIVKITFDNP